MSAVDVARQVFDRLNRGDYLGALRVLGDNAGVFRELEGVLGVSVADLVASIEEAAVASMLRSGSLDGYYQVYDRLAGYMGLRGFVDAVSRCRSVGCVVDAVSKIPRGRYDVSGLASLAVVYVARRGFDAVRDFPGVSALVSAGVDGSIARQVASIYYAGLASELASKGDYVGALRALVSASSDGVLDEVLSVLGDSAEAIGAGAAAYAIYNGDAGFVEEAARVLGGRLRSVEAAGAVLRCGDARCVVDAVSRLPRDVASVIVKASLNRLPRDRAGVEALHSAGFVEEAGLLAAAVAAREDLDPVERLSMLSSLGGNIEYVSKALSGSGVDPNEFYISLFLTAVSKHAGSDRPGDLWASLRSLANRFSSLSVLRPVLDVVACVDKRDLKCLSEAVSRLPASARGFVAYAASSVIPDAISLAGVSPSDSLRYNAYQALKPIFDAMSKDPPDIEAAFKALVDAVKNLGVAEVYRLVSLATGSDRPDVFVMRIEAAYVSRSGDARAAVEAALSHASAYKSLMLPLAVRIDAVSVAVDAMDSQALFKILDGVGDDELQRFLATLAINIATYKKGLLASARFCYDVASRYGFEEAWVFSSAVEFKDLIEAYVSGDFEKAYRLLVDADRANRSSRLNDLLGFMGIDAVAFRRSIELMYLSKVLGGAKSLDEFVEVLDRHINMVPKDLLSRFPLAQALVELRRFASSRSFDSASKVVDSLPQEFRGVAALYFLKMLGGVKPEEYSRVAEFASKYNIQDVADIFSFLSRAGADGFREAAVDAASEAVIAAVEAAVKSGDVARLREIVSRYGDVLNGVRLRVGGREFGLGDAVYAYIYVSSVLRDDIKELSMLYSSALNELQGGFKTVSKTDYDTAYRILSRLENERDMLVMAAAIADKSDEIVDIANNLDVIRDVIDAHRAVYMVKSGDRTGLPILEKLAGKSELYADLYAAAYITLNPPTDDDIECIVSSLVGGGGAPPSPPQRGGAKPT